MQQPNKPEDFQRNMLRSAVSHLDEAHEHLTESMQLFAQLAFNLGDIEKTIHGFKTKITDVIAESESIPIESDIAASIAAKFSPKKLDDKAA